MSAPHRTHTADEVLNFVDTIRGSVGEPTPRTVREVEYLLAYADLLAEQEAADSVAEPPTVAEMLAPLVDMRKSLLDAGLTPEDASTYMLKMLMGAVPK